MSEDKRCLGPEQVVLVVDDDLLNRRIHSCYVRRLGFRPEEQGSGECAVEAFKRARSQGTVIAAIIMDIKMPGIDGLEAAHQIRAIEAAQQVCSCSYEDGVVPSHAEVTSADTAASATLCPLESDACVPDDLSAYPPRVSICKECSTRIPMWAVSTTSLEEQAESPAMKLVHTTVKGPPWSKAGFDAFLLKPVHQLQLVKLLTSVKNKGSSRSKAGRPVGSASRIEAHYLERKSPTSQNSAQTRNSPIEWSKMADNHVALQICGTSR